MTSHDTITPPPAHELPEAASEAAQVTLETGQPTEAPAEARTEVPAPARAYVPVKPKVKASHGVPRLLAYPYRTTPERADSVAAAADSIPADSVAAHTTAVIEGEHMQGIVLINPAAAYRDADPRPNRRAGAEACRGYTSASPCSSASSASNSRGASVISRR